MRGLCGWLAISVSCLLSRNLFPHETLHQHWLSQQYLCKHSSFVTKSVNCVIPSTLLLLGQNNRWVFTWLLMIGMSINTWLDEATTLCYSCVCLLNTFLYVSFTNNHSRYYLTDQLFVVLLACLFLSLYCTTVMWPHTLGESWESNAGLLTSPLGNLYYTTWSQYYTS